VYHLLLFQTNGLQDIADFEAIRAAVSRINPDIVTWIYSITLSPEDLYRVENNSVGVKPIHVKLDVDQPLWRTIASRPLLMFSPVPLVLQSNLRGYRYFGEHVSKVEEMRLLHTRGFPVPRTLPLDRDACLDEAEWGPVVVLKPAGGRGGINIRLMPTAELSRMLRQDSGFPDNGPAMLAQQWIDTGPFINSYRAMTVLDKVTYIYQSTTLEPRQFSAAGIGPEGVNITSNGQARELSIVHDDDVHALALSIARGLTFTPTFGIDIVREAGTNRLFVLELNSGFPTWHLSSRRIHHLVRGPAKFGAADLLAQYNAIEEISASLAEATVRLAM
jgi:hypothetical protein